MQVYDVIVVGAGPAGAAAARQLAFRGLKTLMIDSCHFPRQKLCGGLLTLRAKKAYQRAFVDNWQEGVLKQASGAEFYLGNRLLQKLSDQPKLFLTDRFLFDHLLFKHALDAGAEALTGVGVKLIKPEDNTVTLADGRIFGYRYLLGCDGVNSVVARTLFGRCMPKGKAAAALELDVPLCQTTYRTDVPQIFFGVVRWGYAWIFPKGDKLTIGLGALPEKNANLKDVFTQFLASRLGEVPHQQIKGHLVPFGAFRKTAVQNNILLCGDAAGLVDTITGEGIAFAMSSGYLAAKAVLAHIDKPQSVAEVYSRAYENLKSSLMISARLNWLIFPRWSESLFTRVFPRAQDIAELHMRLMADEISYQSYQREILQRLLGKLLAKLLHYKK